MTKPIIGITLDSEEAGEYSSYPWYALRKDYFSAIAELGGIPIALPYHASLVDDYLTMIDGLILSGGDVDIPPGQYGEATTSHDTLMLKEDRTRFEWTLLETALKRHIPVLGICAGEQLLNAMLGGTLVQHIPDDIPDALEHKQPMPHHEPYHEVTVKEGTLLHRITGKTTIKTNSHHHQAVRDVGKDLVVNAVASDGVIEGIEHTDHPFCLGIEWHPEYIACEEDRAIMQALIKAASV